MNYISPLTNALANMLDLSLTRRAFPIPSTERQHVYHAQLWIRQILLLLLLLTGAIYQITKSRVSSWVDGWMDCKQRHTNKRFELTICFGRFESLVELSRRTDCHLIDKLDQIN